MAAEGSKKRIAFLVSGGGTNMQAVLDEIASGSIAAQPVVVISSNPSAYALERAKQHGIPCYSFSLKDFESADLRNEQILKTLKEHGAELVILAGYLGVIPPKIIAEFPDKIVNIHPSLLPSYGGKGCHGIIVHQMVLAAREPFTGATVHFVNEGMDTGQIIAQKRVQILDTDTPEILQKKVMKECEYPLLCEVVKKLCEGFVFLDGEWKNQPR